MPSAKKKSTTKSTPILQFAHFSLALAGLMWVFSFLNYYHAYPVTTFYQEWGTAMLGLAAMALLLGKDYWNKAEIPRIVMLPIGLMLLGVLQYAIGKIPYFGQMLLYTLYLMWAALLVMLGARLREKLGLPAVATFLAVCLLVGAELNALAGLHQHYHWHSFLDRVVTVKVSPAVFGNVAQPNHYADYLTLGLISLGLLYARRALRWWQAALLALPILFVLPLTGSRSTWYYLTALCISTGLWQWRNRSQRPLLYYAALVLLGFGLMHLVIQLPGFAVESGDAVNSVQRMFSEDVQSGRVRLRLIPEAWIIFTQFPLLGAGFGQYAWQHYLLAPTLNTGLLGLYNNAHNVVMQLAAETGLAGVLILAGTLLLWLRQAFRAERTIYHWWGYGLLLVLAIHSMGEYPLWYAYFLGIAALLLGLLDGTRFRLELGGVGRVFVLLTLGLGTASLYQLYSGYRTIEELTQMRPQPGNPAPYYERMNRGIAEIQTLPLLQPYADLLSSSMMDIGPERLDAKLKLNGNAERFVPIAQTVYRESLLLAQSGDLFAAEAEMERAIWSYPGDFPMVQDSLQRLVVGDAAHFAALLEFAIRKQKEYQSAVHTK